MSDNTTSNVIIVYKTPDYIIQSKQNYYLKNKDTPEFKAKKNESVKAYREKYKDEYNEKQKLYMRDRRAKAKLLKQQHINNNDNITQS
jgi:hypothetical protein